MDLWTFDLKAIPQNIVTSAIFQNIKLNSLNSISRSIIFFRSKERFEIGVFENTENLWVVLLITLSLLGFFILQEFQVEIKQYKLILFLPTFFMHLPP